MNRNEYRKTEQGRLKRNQSRKENYAQTRKHAKNQGLPYSSCEDYMILKHDLSDRTISFIIGRSVQAIQIRRHRLKNKK